VKRKEKAKMNRKVDSTELKPKHRVKAKPKRNESQSPKPKPKIKEMGGHTTARKAEADQWVGGGIRVDRQSETGAG
jgi:hypothetical protein